MDEDDLYYNEGEEDWDTFLKRIRKEAEEDRKNSDKSREN